MPCPAQPLGSVTHVKYMSESGHISHNIQTICSAFAEVVVSQVSRNGCTCVCVCVCIFYKLNSYVITNMIIKLFWNCCLLINQCGLERVFLHLGHMDWCPDDTDM
jgi:hypothetical protein